MTKKSSDTYLPYGRQTITEADIAAVTEALRSPFLTQGTTVPAFEHAVASKVNSTHGVACNSATSALHVACRALGLRRGWLWTTPITFGYIIANDTAEQMLILNIDPDTGLISIRS